MLTTKEMRELIEYACDEMGCPGFSNKIKVKWNKRFTTTLGKAIYHVFTEHGTIELALKLWPTMTKEKQEDLILHECAHLLANHLYPESSGEGHGGHGPTWKRICRQIGCKPERYACDQDADFVAHKRRRTRYTIKCDCPDGVTVTKHMLTKMKKYPYYYKCKKCKCILSDLTVLDKVVL